LLTQKWLIRPLLLWGTPSGGPPKRLISRESIVRKVGRKNQRNRPQKILSLEQWLSGKTRF
jgi:hypothetical protein